MIILIVTTDLVDLAVEEVVDQLLLTILLHLQLQIQVVEEVLVLVIHQLTEEMVQLVL